MIRVLNPDLEAMLTRDEGRKLEAYKDSLGNWTIGVGHLLGDKPRMTEITNAECDALLRADIDVAFAQMQKTFLNWHRHNDARVNALVNMCFNLGPKVEQFTHFIAAMNESNYTDAARFMLESLWAKQVGQRATRLSNTILKGLPQ